MMDPLMLMTFLAGTFFGVVIGVVANTYTIATFAATQKPKG